MFYAKVLSYEVCGNVEEGYDINNIYNEGIVRLNGEYDKLTDKQILKRINGKAGSKEWNGIIPTIKIDMRSLSIDNGYMTADIHITDKKGIKPVGRIELYDKDMNKIY